MATQEEKNNAFHSAAGTAPSTPPVKKPLLRQSQRPANPGPELDYTSHPITGEQYDSSEIQKRQAQKQSIIERQTAFDKQWHEEAPLREQEAKERADKRAAQPVETQRTRRLSPAQQIVENVRSGGASVMKHQELIGRIQSHKNDIQTNLVALNSVWNNQKAELGPDHPAIKDLQNAQDHLHATDDLLSHYHELGKVGPGESQPRKERTEALQAAALGVQGALTHATSDNVFKLHKGLIPSPVSADEVQNTVGHAMSLDAGREFKRRGNLGSQRIAGVQLYGDDPGLQGALKRVRARKAAGTEVGIDPLTLGVFKQTPRYTAREATIAGGGDTAAGRELLAKNVQYKKRETTGSAATYVSGTRPFGGSESQDVSNIGKVIPGMGDSPKKPEQVKEVNKAKDEAESRRASERSQRKADRRKVNEDRDITRAETKAKVKAAGLEPASEGGQFITEMKPSTRRVIREVQKVTSEQEARNKAQAAVKKSQRSGNPKASAGAKAALKGALKNKGK